MVVPVKDIIKKYIEENLGVARVSEEYAASKAWSSLDAKDIIKNSAFDKLVDGTLYVNAKNSAWAQRISLLKKDLIAKLNERAGRIIKDIKVRAGIIDDAAAAEKAKVERKCPKCGVEHSKDTEHCPVCDRQIKQSTRLKVYRLVDENPKLSLSEARGAVPEIGSDEFRKIKRDMNSLKYNAVRKEWHGNKKTSGA